MTEYRKLEAGFLESEWPEIECPTCRKSLVATEGGAIGFEQTTESILRSSSKNRHQEWDPSWLSGVFQGYLVCENRKCKAKLFVSGLWEYEQVILEDEKGESFLDYEHLLSPEYFIPPLNLVEPLPPSAPQFLSERVTEVSKLIWIDHNAAATRIRYAVEQILDDLKIPSARSLHDRIIIFQSKNEIGGKALLAIKHLGNDGTHDLSLTKLQVFDSLEFFETALRAIYVEPSQDIQSKITQVNQSH